MYSYLPVLGITEKTKPEIEQWAQELLLQLNTHFEQHPFLLGTKPCLGDFGLYGPLYALVWRDPALATHRVSTVSRLASAPHENRKKDPRVIFER